jgi:murein DD-endopeptidase MepM/ murein hydrolase activator NlpD
MQFKDAMNMILPPINGVYAHITSPGDFGAGVAQGRNPPSTIPHIGVDMNYIGGQSGINLTHPDVFSPVSGIVTKAGGGRFNTITIKDINGNSHQILHTQDQYVTVGQQVFAGDLIGTMGNTGVRDQHVHYQIYSSAGNLLNPHAVWGQYLPEYQRYVDATSANAGNGSYNVLPDTGEHTTCGRPTCAAEAASAVARQTAAERRRTALPNPGRTAAALQTDAPEPHGGWHGWAVLQRAAANSRWHSPANILYAAR